MDCHRSLLDVFVRAIEDGDSPEPDRVEAAHQRVAGMLNVEGLEMFRGWADLAFGDFQRGDMAGAESLIDKLQREWDRGSAELRQSDPRTWNITYQAIVLYAESVVEYQRDRAEVSVSVAYQDLLYELAQAE